MTVNSSIWTRPILKQVYSEGLNPPPPWFKKVSCRNVNKRNTARADFFLIISPDYVNKWCNFCVGNLADFVNLSIHLFIHISWIKTNSIFYPFKFCIYPFGFLKPLVSMNSPGSCVVRRNPLNGESVEMRTINSFSNISVNLIISILKKMFLLNFLFFNNWPISNIWPRFCQFVPIIFSYLKKFSSLHHSRKTKLYWKKNF